MVLKLLTHLLYQIQWGNTLEIFNQGGYNTGEPGDMSHPCSYDMYFMVLKVLYLFNISVLYSFCYPVSEQSTNLISCSLINTCDVSIFTFFFFFLISEENVFWRVQITYPKSHSYILTELEFKLLSALLSAELLRRNNKRLTRLQF